VLPGLTQAGAGNALRPAHPTTSADAISIIAVVIICKRGFFIYYKKYNCKRFFPFSNV